jgi:hypothetical protein
MSGGILMQHDDIDLGAALDPQPQATAHLEAEIVEERALPPVPTYDPQPALVKILEFEKAVKDLVALGKTIAVIKDKATDEKAISIAAKMKKIRNRMEEIRHYFVDPPFQYKKKIDNFFKKYTDPLEEGERTLARKSGAFRMLLEQERRRKEAEAEAENRRIQQDLDDQAAKAKAEGKPFEAVTVVPQIMPAVPKVTRTEEGSASQRRKITFKVENEALIPDEYWIKTLDEKKVLEHLKSGAKIPGITETEEFITNIRV